MSADKDLLVAGEPRVQLLPPAVKAREKAREARSLAILLTVLAMALVGLGVVYAFFSVATAQQAVLDAQVDQQAILAEQQTYAAGAQAAQAVSETEEAISYAGLNDISWQKFIDEVQEGMPVSVTIDSAHFMGRAPWEAPLNSESPLRPPRQAKAEIVFASPTLLDPINLYRTLASNVTGFQDAFIYDSTFQYDKGRYLTRVSMTLNEGALTGRYNKDAIDALLQSFSNSDPTPAPTATPAPTDTPAPSDSPTPAPTSASVGPIGRSN